jgi:caffeoyl-CoA O-methyltransferase
MKRKLVILGIAAGLLLAGWAIFYDVGDVIVSVASPAAPVSPPKTEAEQRVLSVLQEMQENGGTYLSVSETKGRVLRLLAEAVGAKHVVEIGTSTGYSGLWFCLALQATGGRLTTFEIDHGRATTARENFKRAGVAQIATVVEGDAHEKIAQVNEPVDVAFIDADKDGYPDYLRKLLPKVRPGGLIIADNLTMASAYREAVTTNPDLETVVWGRDLAITLKKR